MTFKSGFATIVGRTNVGKSTLINQILGEKFVIVSDKPQTTRNKISAIYNSDDSQIIFLDTPGIHKPRNELSKSIVRSAKRTLNEVDVVIFMVDSSLKIGPGDKYILNILKTVDKPIILLVNKTDLINKNDFIKIQNNFKEYNFINEIIGISAINGLNINTFLTAVESYLEEGPQYYPQDMVIDQPERMIVSELIREKLLEYLHQEVPHGVLVQINSMKKREDQDIVDIRATIICEKNSHKGIIIGKNGRKIKGVGKSARLDIERLLGSKVYLDLWVKVRKDWRNDESYLKKMGY